MSAPRLLRVLPAANDLGEGVVWSPHEGAFWWTDIEARKLWRYDLAGEALCASDTPERLGSFCFTADPERLLCAFETGFALFAPRSGRLEWLHRLEAPGSGRRLNDGRIDRQGRFWAGSMVEDAARAGANSGRLHRLDGDGSLHALLGGVSISNGLASSPDGRRLYFADSPTRRVRAFALDPATGDLSGERVLLETPEGQYPDGATVDASGVYYSALWGGGRVLSLGPEGARGGFEVPAPQPTCLAFGGPELRHVLVVSARTGLSEETLAAHPQSGHAFLYAMPGPGLPDAVWAGAL